MPRPLSRIARGCAPVALLVLLAGPVAAATTPAPTPAPTPASAPAPAPAGAPITDFRQQRPEGKTFAPAPVDAGDAAFSRGLPPARPLLGDRENKAGAKLDVAGLQNRFQSLLDRRYQADVKVTARKYEQPSPLATVGYLAGFPAAVAALGALVLVRSRRRQTRTAQEATA